jgi:hypothetical protein
MDTARFDDLARGFGHHLGRRRVVAALAGGLGLATLGWLRPHSAAAKIRCDNCDYVCGLCAERGTRISCNLCAQCGLGACYECPGPAPCNDQP